MIKSLSLSKNDQISTRLAWSSICETFIFTRLTPYLTELNLGFMSLRDDQVRYITNMATQFFG